MPNPRANWWETGGGADAYGTRPVIPLPTQTQGGALGGNLANLGQIYGLTGGVNSAGAANAAGNLTANVPGLAERSHGQLPMDVITQLLQQAAERGISTGAPGGPSSNASYLRALGLTSLGVSTDAAHELEAGIAGAPKLDPNRLIVTPEDQQAAAVAQSLYRAAPDPAAAAAASRANAAAGIGAGLGTGGGGPWWSQAYANVNSYTPFGMPSHW